MAKKKIAKNASKKPPKWQIERLWNITTPLEHSLNYCRDLQLSTVVIHAMDLLLSGFGLAYLSSF